MGPGKPGPYPMRGWLVNDRLTAIPGTRTFWHHLLDAVDGLVDKTTGSYSGLAEAIEYDCAREAPDYIIRNAASFRAPDVSCPVIAFVQDLLDGSARRDLIDACSASRLLVFNSAYTREHYPELHSMPHEIIPIGTDLSIFNQAGSTDHSDAVLWVGSGHPVKGFNLACRLAAESPRDWVFAMKDDTPVPVGKVFRRINQNDLADLARSCAVGVCTSLRETQHLAGIEMGFCGLPLVTTDVGVYYGRKAGAWGEVSRGDWHVEIERSAVKPRRLAAAYWASEGFDLVACMERWNATIAKLEPVHVG